MRCTIKFIGGKSADIYEGLVGELDFTTDVCSGDKDIPVLHQDFTVSYRTVVTHGNNCSPHCFT